jgi:ribosomal protein L34E
MTNARPDIPIKRIVALAAFIIAAIAIPTIFIPKYRLLLVKMIPMITLFTVLSAATGSFVISMTKTELFRRDPKRQQSGLKAVAFFFPLVATLFLCIGALLGDGIASRHSARVLPSFILGLGGLIPSWMIAFAAVSILDHRVTHQCRTHENHCARCDYDLRGITSDRCPECGGVISEDQPASRPLDAFLHPPPLKRVFTCAAITIIAFFMLCSSRLLSFL